MSGVRLTIDAADPTLIGRSSTAATAACTLAAEFIFCATAPTLPTIEAVRRRIGAAGTALTRRRSVALPSTLSPGTDLVGGADLLTAAAMFRVNALIDAASIAGGQKPPRAAALTRPV